MSPRCANRAVACLTYACWLAWVAGAAPAWGQASGGPANEAQRRASVGMPQRIEQLVLPGRELIAKAIDSREVPLVLRVVATYPHGTDCRYDLEYYGLEPGRYNLADYLQRKDGTATTGLPEISVEIVSLLPAGQIVPADPSAAPPPQLGGYRQWLAWGAVAWVAGLAAIFLARRRAQRRARAVSDRPLSLAERLRPMVAAAVAGRLSPVEMAQIERLLLTYWRRRLNLDAEDPWRAVAVLRQHAEAGALLRQVESWLHAPQGAEQVDLTALLAPYSQLADDPDEQGAEQPATTGDRL